MKKNICNNSSKLDFSLSLTALWLENNGFSCSTSRCNGDNSVDEIDFFFVLFCLIKFSSFRLKVILIFPPFFAYSVGIKLKTLQESPSGIWSNEIEIDEKHWWGSIPLIISILIWWSFIENVEIEKDESNFILCEYSKILVSWGFSPKAEPYIKHRMMGLDVLSMSSSVNY